MSSAVDINQPTTAPELSFTGLSGYSVDTPDTIMTTSDGVILSQDGSNSFSCSLPPTLKWAENKTEATTVGTPIVEELDSYTVYKAYTYMVFSTRYEAYTRYPTQTTSAQVEKEYQYSYTVDEWKINNVSYDSEDEVTIRDKKTSAVAVIDWVKDLLAERNVTNVKITAKDSYVKKGLKKSEIDTSKIVENVYTDSEGTISDTTTVN